MKILAIETSTDLCSICYSENNRIIDSINKKVDNSHSKYLAPLVNKIINNNKINLSEIDYFALSIGPGSYSGLKVGSSFLKGLAFSQDKSIIPINTIEALNYMIRDTSKYSIAIYSHRNHVYYQNFSDGKPINSQKCELIDNISKNNIYGYGLNNFENIKYKECKPSADILINYINDNKSIIDKIDSNISPIFLSTIENELL